MKCFPPQLLQLPSKATAGWGVIHGRSLREIFSSNRTSCLLYFFISFQESGSPFSHPIHKSNPGCFTFLPTPRKAPRSSSLFELNANFPLATFSVSIVLYGAGGVRPWVMNLVFIFLTSNLSPL